MLTGRSFGDSVAEDSRQICYSAVFFRLGRMNS
jgi:hypothetical protein